MRRRVRRRVRRPPPLRQYRWRRPWRRWGSSPRPYGTTGRVSTLHPCCLIYCSTPESLCLPGVQETPRRPLDFLGSSAEKRGKCRTACPPVGVCYRFWAIADAVILRAGAGSQSKRCSWVFCCRRAYRCSGAAAPEITAKRKISERARLIAAAKRPRAWQVVTLNTRAGFGGGAGSFGGDRQRFVRCAPPRVHTLS